MFSKFFINRPIFATVISLLIILAGLLSIFSLPVEQYPNLTPPSVAVDATYTGADPSVIAETVAAPIEQQVNGVEDMIYMNSTSSSNGSMNLLVYFKVGTDPDQAVINVNNRVQAATAQLPQDVRRYGVQVTKKSSAILLIISLISPDGLYDTTYMGNYGLINIVDELKRLPGVGDAQVMTNNDYSMRVWLKPDIMSQVGISAAEVVNAISGQNQQRAAGSVGQEPAPSYVEKTYTVNASGRLKTPEEFQEIILRADPDGTALRLKDVAEIQLGSQTYSFLGSDDKRPAVPIGVYLTPGANAVSTAEEVKAAMTDMASRFPNGMTYQIPYDTTTFVKQSIKEVVITLIEAMILVFLVVYIFLQDWRATLIPCLAVPVSIIGAFAGMSLLGFSINTLTMFGLVLAIGMVVDDAIIVIENVERIMYEENISVKDAAIKAMEEVQGAVVAIVFVLCSVFVPVAFMGGFTGVMYKQFAITIAVSVVISGFVALTLTPALCALLLKKKEKKTKGFFFRFDQGFDKLTQKYTTYSSFFIRHVPAALVVILLILLAIFSLFRVVPGSLLPEEDQGLIIIAAMNDPATSLQKSAKVSAEIEDLILAQPGVEQEISFTGFDLLNSTQKTSSAAFFVLLKPWDERKTEALSANGIISTIGKEAYFKIPSAIVMPFNPPPILGMNTTGGLEGYIQNRGSGGSDVLQAKVEEYLGELKKHPQIASVNTTFSAIVPQFNMEVDSIKAVSKGVSLDDLYATMQATFGTYYVNDFTKFGRSFKVIVQALGDYRARPEQIDGIYVKSNTGAMIPLSALVNMKPTLGSDVIERFNVFPAAKVIVTPAKGVSSGTVIKLMEDISSKVLGQDFSLAWTGSTYQEKLTGGASTNILFLGMLVVFLILAAQYEKWGLPFAVILAVPFGIFGALVGTWMRGLENDIYFQIAMVALIGLSAKNAILIVEFAVQQKEQGMSVFEAALHAVKLRFRPIIMTSLAFILGCLPLAISTGAGAAGRHSIGTAVVAGMLGATIILPLFVPLFFYLISGGRKEDKKQRESDLNKKEEI